MSLLIDGYNLLHAAGLLGPGVGPGGLERSRLALIGHLAAALAPEELAQTTIVFDAAGAPPGLPSVLKSHGLTILFAVGYADADTLIEELIRSEPNPRRLVVVSSDHRLQRAARRRKASAVQSGAWYDELSRRRQRQVPAEEGPAAAARPAAPLVEEEVAYWLGQFGGESVVDRIRRQERRREGAEAKPKTEEPGPEGPPPDDPSGGKLTPDEAADIANPFPPGYAEDLLEEGSGESDG